MLVRYNISDGIHTGAGHGCGVRLGTEVSFVTRARCRTFTHRVTVRRTFGAAGVTGQSSVVADLTGWSGGREKERESMISITGFLLLHVLCIDVCVVARSALENGAVLEH